MNKRLGTTAFAFIWLIAGLVYIGLGLNGYYKYSQGRLWLFMTLNTLYIRDIVFGLLAIWVGIKLLPRLLDENNILDAQAEASVPNRKKWVYSYPIWIIGFIFFSTIIENVFPDRVIDSFELQPLFYDFILTIDYLFLYLAYHTLSCLEDTEPITKDTIVQFVLENFLFLLIGMAVLLGLIFGGAELLPYELFHWIHD